VKLITIDGSMGEGGGQVLRTALTMSLATGQPFRIDQIRGKRPKPGLLRQHLTAVRAAAAISNARVDGAELGSRALEFAPGAVVAGDYTFAVGTAGSATLVMQTVLMPLLFAGGASALTLEGGTHNPWAPPFDFIDRVLLPIVNRLGGRVTAALERRGFYPAGGGRFTVTLQPAARLARLELLERGEIRERKATVILANLPRHIAERELERVTKLLNWTDGCGSIEAVDDASGPGNVVLVETIAEHATEICTGFGEMRTPAEGVAERAAKDMRRYLSAGVPVGLHLADQLMPILALGAGGSYRTLSLSRHALTNADVIRQFAGVSIETTNEARDVVRVDVEKR
jgi:RNA 3'-terminal phosphate cyclase (ATP)